MANTASLEYLGLLYNDLKQKLETIRKYMKAINSQVGDIYQSTYEGIYLCKKKMEIMSQYEKRAPKVRPQTEFAIEERPRNERKEADGQDVQDNLEDLNTKLKAVFAEINYRFGKQQNNLVQLNNCHAELQGLINGIFESWEGINDPPK